MGSGKPVGDGIYWPLNKIEEERLLSSQRGARNQANMRPADNPPPQASNAAASTAG